ALDRSRLPMVSFPVHLVSGGCTAPAGAARRGIGPGGEYRRMRKADMVGRIAEELGWKVFQSCGYAILSSHRGSNTPIEVRGAIEFILIKPLAATGSDAPGSYAGHSTVPSRHRGPASSTNG